MRTKKILSVLLARAMMSAMFTGCSGGDSTSTNSNTNADNSSNNTGTDDKGGASDSGEIKEFTAFRLCQKFFDIGILVYVIIQRNQRPRIIELRCTVTAVDKVGILPDRELQ